MLSSKLSFKSLCAAVLLFISLPAIILPLALLSVKAQAESYSLIDNDWLVIDVQDAQKQGDVYLIGWDQNAVISYHHDWFYYGLQPVDVPVIKQAVGRSTPAGYYSFLQFTVPHFADPYAINSWQNVKLHQVLIQHCSGFSPVIPGCESKAPW